MRSIKVAFTTLLVVMAATSCKTPTDITYFQDLSDNRTLDVTPTSAITAQPGDRISIIVHSKDEKLAQIFNLPVNNRYVGGGGSSGYGSGSSAYVVDNMGDIDFPIIGNIHIGGMTRHEIERFVKEELIRQELLKDPTVKVEFLDHSFTALGAFSSPGRKTFNRDNLNLIEAIGMAGDLAMNGQRTNVKVIRMEEGKEKEYTVDLTDAKSVFGSPAFYIQQNDVIYVEPNDMAKRSTTPNGSSFLTPAFWMSLISFATSMTLIFVKL